jgi:hypothetical protein
MLWSHEAWSGGTCDAAVGDVGYGPMTLGRIVIAVEASTLGIGAENYLTARVAISGASRGDDGSRNGSELSNAAFPPTFWSQFDDLNH